MGIDIKKAQNFTELSLAIFVF
ncbi:hypothetical protein EMIT0158MI4_70181 [Burkholderia ambifaria]